MRKNIDIEWNLVGELYPTKDLIDVLIWAPGRSLIPAIYYQDFDGIEGFFTIECGYDGEEIQLADWATHWMDLNDIPKPE